ncbi:MAG: MlaA family lipoprotein, partial [Thermodesulfobacteriota bacterium]
MGRWIWKGIFPGLLFVLWTVGLGYAEAFSSDAVSFAAIEKTGPQEVTKPGEEGIEEEGIPDPLEPWNLLMFDFNDSFYFWVYKPFAQGYNYVVA